MRYLKIYKLLLFLCGIQFMYAQQNTNIALNNAFKQMKDVCNYNLDLLYKTSMFQNNLWIDIDSQKIQVFKDNNKFLIEALNYQMYVLDNYLITVDQSQKQVLLRNVSFNTTLDRMLLLDDRILNFFKINNTIQTNNVIKYQLVPIPVNEMPYGLKSVTAIDLYVDSVTNSFICQDFFAKSNNIAPIKMSLKFIDRQEQEQHIPNLDYFFEQDSVNQWQLSSSYNTYTLRTNLKNTTF